MVKGFFVIDTNTGPIRIVKVSVNMYDASKFLCVVYTGPIYVFSKCATNYVLLFFDNVKTIFESCLVIVL